MKKPDNIVFNSLTNEYDSYKKEYPTSFNSKNFSAEKLSKIELDSKPYFQKKLLEIKAKYDRLTTEIKWNELIYRSKYNFKLVYAAKAESIYAPKSPKKILPVRILYIKKINKLIIKDKLKTDGSIEFTKRKNNK